MTFNRPQLSAALGLAFLAGCGGYSAPTSPSGGGTPPPANTVNVVNNSFNPAMLTVPVGTTVTWTWSTTAMGHNVVPDDGATPTTSGPPTNYPHTYTFTFNTAGTYPYHCQLHGGVGGVGMSGTIVVQ